MASDIIGRANHGPLFDPPPVATATMPGAGAVARQVARGKTNATKDRLVVIEAVRGSVDGLTRTEIRSVTGLAQGTVNGRVSEACDPKRYAPDPAPLLTSGTRETWLVGEGRFATESIVRVRP